MTLKTFACDSIAEKNDFVNHFFPSSEMRERGPFCKRIFPDPRNAKARFDFVNHFFPSPEMRERGSFCKRIFPEPRNNKARLIL